MVVNGSLSKTAVNGSAGAKSQMSGMVVAVLTIVTLLFLTGLFEDLPEATLAAVVIAAVVELVDFAALRDFYRLYTVRLGRIYGTAARPDFIAAVAAMLGVLLFDTLPGLIIGTRRIGLVSGRTHPEAAADETHQRRRRAGTVDGADLDRDGFFESPTGRRRTARGTHVRHQPRRGHAAKDDPNRSSEHHSRRVIRTDPRAGKNGRDDLEHGQRCRSLEPDAT